MIKKLKAEVAALKMKLAEAIIGKFAAIKTDKAVLVHDAEELKVGIEVFVEDEEGNRTPAEDGVYVTEDKSRITVEGGRVKEILEAEDDIDTTNAKTPNEKVKVEMAEPITREEFDREKEGIYKEINELYKLMDGLMKKVGADRNALDARMRAIEKAPAGRRPSEEYNNDVTTPKTGDAKLDRKLAYVQSWAKK